MSKNINKAARKYLLELRLQGIGIRSVSVQSTSQPSTPTTRPNQNIQDERYQQLFKKAAASLRRHQ